MGQLAKTFRLSRIPLYLQVAATLRRRIAEGHWAPGAKIATLDKLQAEFEVARVTVRQAVELLQKEGLVRRLQGKGTFVAEGIEDSRWLTLESSWSSLIGNLSGIVPKFVPVGTPLRAPRLKAGEGRLADDYVFLKSVQQRGTRVYSLVSVHLAKDIYGKAPERFRRHAALSVLAAMKGVGIASAHQTLVIASADPETARLLKVPLNSPTAEAHCVVIDRRGVAIYIADIIYRGDCIRIETSLLEPPERRGEP